MSQFNKEITAWAKGVTEPYDEEGFPTEELQAAEVVGLKQEEEFVLSQVKICQLISCGKRYAVRDSDAITPELYCSVDCELTEGEKELLDGSDNHSSM